MSEHNIEERLVILESKMAAYELFKEEQETRDEALRRIERIQMRSYEELRAGQVNTTTELRKEMANSASELRNGQDELRTELRKEFRAHQVYMTDRSEAFEEYIKTRINAIEADTDALIAFSTQHDVAIEGLTGDVRNLAGNVLSLAEDVQSLAEITKEHGTAIQALAELAKEHTTAIEGLTGDVRELKGDVRELKGDLRGLAGTVQGLEAGQQQILDLLTAGKPKIND